MKNKILILALLGIANTEQKAEAQQPKVQNANSGKLQFGFRGTVNPHLPSGASWLSYGAQLSLKVARRFNSEWFADYYPSAGKGNVERNDIRIGAAALYYPLHEIYTGKVCTPYFSIGTSYTSSKITTRNLDSQLTNVSRWGIGLIAGMGMLLHISPKFDLGFVSQYLGQVGSQFKTGETTALNNSERIIVQQPDTRINYEGQMIFCMSVNYTLGDLW